jgi:hypothetical protein
MTAPSQEEIKNVAQAIAALHIATVQDPDVSRAGEATANLCSSAGAALLYAPPGLQQLITNAIEIGYAAALQDVRDGTLGGDLQN